jgi:hypothetical protein
VSARESELGEDNMLRRVMVGGIAAIALVAFTGVTAVQANPVTEFTTKFNTDVAYAGLGGMRGTDGSGDIVVDDVTGTVTSAFLYWHGPTDSNDPDSNAAVTFNGTPIVGTNIGSSSDNCWDFNNSQAYRADVTLLVSGNGSYSLAGFTKPSVEINGVSLVVFFDDGNAANNRDIVMFDGNDSNVEFAGPPEDPEGWDVTLSGINYASGDVALDMIVADGQAFGEAALDVNGNEIVPAGEIFDGNTVPNADESSAEDTEGGLWDVRSFDVTAQLTPGPNTLNLTTAYEDDCLSLIVAAVDLPAGAAPNQPTTTTTSTTSTTAPPQANVQPRFTG